MSDTPFTFSLFAIGYPMPQGHFCAAHLCPAMLKDASHPGGTDGWTVRLSKKPCRTCAEGAPDV